MMFVKPLAVTSSAAILIPLAMIYSLDSYSRQDVIYFGTPINFGYKTHRMRSLSTIPEAAATTNF
jgi:hypothetical protein